MIFFSTGPVLSASKKFSVKICTLRAVICSFRKGFWTIQKFSKKKCDVICLQSLKFYKNFWHIFFFSSFSNSFFIIFKTVFVLFKNPTNPLASFNGNAISLSLDFLGISSTKFFKSINFCCVCAHGEIIQRGITGLSAFHFAI